MAVILLVPSLVVDPSWAFHGPCAVPTAQVLFDHQALSLKGTERSLGSDHPSASVLAAIHGSARWRRSRVRSAQEGFIALGLAAVSACIGGGLLLMIPESREDQARANQAFAEVWRLYRHHPERLFAADLADPNIRAFVEEVAAHFVTRSEGKATLRMYVPTSAQRPISVPFVDFPVREMDITTYGDLRELWMKNASTHIPAARVPRAGLPFFPHQPSFPQEKWDGRRFNLVARSS
jgi:hypothetical protein